MKINLSTKKGFSLIEVIVGMFIFGIGLSGIAVLLVTTINANGNNRDRLIAGQLANEGVELVRNIRDTNYRDVRVWNAVSSDGTSVFDKGVYKIRQNYSYNNPEHNLDKVDMQLTGPSLPTDISPSGLSDYRLCKNTTEYNRYEYCNILSGAKEETPYYRLLEVSELKDDSGTIIEDAYQINSHVYWFRSGAKELTIRTIIADWKQL